MNFIFWSGSPKNTLLSFKRRKRTQLLTWKHHNSKMPFPSYVSKLTFTSFFISLNKIKSIFLIVFRYTEMYNCTRCRLSTFKSFLIKNFQLRICYVIEKFWNFELFEISSFGPILGFEVERYKQHLKSFSLVQKVRLRNKYYVIVFWNYM